MNFFSVIIPTYNRVDLIAETINSVLGQTWSNYEIIIVDDGSTDNTGQVIRENYGSNSRVKYFYKENEERGAARNFGLRQSKGDYAVFFDSDDWMKPHYLETLNQIIEEHPGIYLLAAKYNFRDEEGKEKNAAIGNLAEGWYDRRLFLKGNILAANYCMRMGFSMYAFPEERELASMEDWLFLLRNLEDKKIFIGNRICLTMRQHQQRSMSNNQKVIAARNHATAWALQHINLNEGEKKMLRAWSHYFCGIHQYLDNKRWPAIKEVLAATGYAGPNIKFLILAGKALIGRKRIVRYK